MNNSYSSYNPSQTDFDSKGNKMLWGFESGVGTEATQQDLEAPISDSVSTTDLKAISLPGLRETLNDCEDLLQLRIEWNKDFKEYIDSICDLTIPGNGAKVSLITKNIKTDINLTKDGWNEYANQVTKSLGQKLGSKSAYHAHYLKTVFLRSIDDDIKTLNHVSSLIKNVLTSKTTDEMYTVIFEVVNYSEVNRLNKNENFPQDWDEGPIFQEIARRIFAALPENYRQDFETYICLEKVLDGKDYRIVFSPSPRFKADVFQIQNDFILPNLDASQAANYPNLELLKTAVSLFLEMQSVSSTLAVPKDVPIEESINNLKNAPDQFTNFSHFYALFIDLRDVVRLLSPSFVFKSELMARNEQAIAKKPEEKIEQETEQNPSVPKKKKKNKKKKQATVGEDTNASKLTEQMQKVEEEEELLHVDESLTAPQTQEPNVSKQSATPTTTGIKSLDGNTEDARSIADESLTAPQTQEPNVSKQSATPTTTGIKSLDGNTEDARSIASERLQQLRLNGEESRIESKIARKAAIVAADKQMRQGNVQDRAIKPIINIDIAKEHLDKLEDLFNPKTQKLKYSTVETLFTSLGITRLNQRGSHITMSFSGRAVGYFETDIEDEDQSDAIAKFTVVKPHGKTKTQAVMNNNLISLRRSIKNILPLEIQQELHITGDSLVTNSGTKKNTFKL